MTPEALAELLKEMTQYERRDFIRKALKSFCRICMRDKDEGGECYCAVPYDY